MLHLIVFTKDRACQLEMLKESIQRFTDPMQVMVTTIASKGKKFEFEVKDELDSGYEYTAFMPDDCIFTQSINFGFLPKVMKDDICCFSLRLGLNITYDLPLSIVLKPQVITINDKVVYKVYWSQNQGYFGYPMSVDGHVFRTEELIKTINPLAFANPNYLETELNRHPIARPYMAFTAFPTIINLAMNKVQDTHPHNKAGDFTPEYLQVRYAKGHRLDLDRTIKSIEKAKSCHIIPTRLYWKGDVA